MCILFSTEVVPLFLVLSAISFQPLLTLLLTFRLNKFYRAQYVSSCIYKSQVETNKKHERIDQITTSANGETFAV